MPKGWSNLKTHKIPLKIAINWPYSGIDTKSLKFVHIYPPDKTPSQYSYYGDPIFLDTYFHQKQPYFTPPVHPLN